MKREWKESKKRGGGRTRRKTKIIKIDEEEEKKRNKILYTCTHIHKHAMCAGPKEYYNIVSISFF